MRAMETAYNMFFLGPKGKPLLQALVPNALVPVPYMIEKHHGEHGFVQMDNLPFPSAQQLDMLQSRHGKNFTDLIDAALNTVAIHARSSSGRSLKHCSRWS